MDECIQPYTTVAIRLPSDAVKVQQVLPNTSISLGKFGSFPANLIIGRPYHLTFEILDKTDGRQSVSLRVVPPNELYEDIREEHADIENQTPRGEGNEADVFEVVNPEGKVVMRTNRNIVDDGGAQKLTAEDIEALKKVEKASGKDTIAKILESHSALDQKTTFSLAKYTLRKRKKYMKRFTVIPMDVVQLAGFMFHEKEAKVIMEIREEMLSLIMTWANVHCGGQESVQNFPETPEEQQMDHHRWLVIDETGGLIVAALAERIGILYPTNEEGRKKPKASLQHLPTSEEPAFGIDTTDSLSLRSPRAAKHPETPHSEADNTITLIHPATQPNISLLSNFSYDPSAPNPSHPLFHHLKTLSWLQLLHPTEDCSYREPSALSHFELSALKPGKRSAYYRKRRRWHRVSSVVDQTRAGGFAGLIVASHMEAADILHHCVPLLRGGSQVVVYAPTIEPLVQLMDYYSKSRRGAFLTERAKRTENGEGLDSLIPSAEYPMDPTLLLATAVHTAKARPWQVLPGRTHPLMMGRGGADGFIFVGTRVLPAEGRVSPRGQPKRRKTTVSEELEETSKPRTLLASAVNSFIK